MEPIIPVVPKRKSGQSQLSFDIQQLEYSDAVLGLLITSCIQRRMVDGKLAVSITFLGHTIITNLIGQGMSKKDVANLLGIKVKELPAKHQGA